MWGKANYATEAKEQADLERSRASRERMRQTSSDDSYLNTALLLGIALSGSDSGGSDSGSSGGSDSGSSDSGSSGDK